MRSLGLVTTSRSEWGILRPVAHALRAWPEVRLTLIAAGTHLAEAFGATVADITADGFEVRHRLDYLQPGDSPADVARSMGVGVAQFAALFARWRPDLLLVTADRFDMIPAAVAATPFGIPLAHLHGGEVTEGAMDDTLRHAMTKLCHLHLVAAETHARRVRQMGEPPERVHVVGAPGLDELRAFEPLPPEQLRDRFGFVPGECNLVVAYHPETRAGERTGADAAELFAALRDWDAHLVVVGPNADPGHDAIRRALEVFRRRRPDARIITHVPRYVFLSLLHAASALVGNSSAGIWEAPSLLLPVVNVGRRQAGRLRAANVVDCAPAADDIRRALRRALDPAFRTGLAGLVNPYGDGHSGPRIARLLATIPLTPALLAKPFVDWRYPEAAAEPSCRPVALESAATARAH